MVCEYNQGPKIETDSSSITSDLGRSCVILSKEENISGLVLVEIEE